MTTQIKNSTKKPIVIILSVVAVVLWIYNGYQLLHGFLHHDNYEQENDSRDIIDNEIDYDTLAQQEIFIYRSKFRDPFQSSLGRNKQHKIPEIKREDKIELKEVPPPGILLKGILHDKSGALAIIESPAGETIFLRESDRVMDILIVRIEHKKLFCDFHGRMLEYTLD
ncbi:MAG: hypothetical protein V2J62_09920 [candidate division KSB1 bacterium]|jgi:hypothetical protein|nr:hypothetical protein [candidate division KSB1 bacterium]